MRTRAILYSNLEKLEDNELDARRLGVLEIDRSKTRVAFKMARGSTAAFDRSLVLLGFFVTYFVVLTYAPAFVAWVAISGVGMALLKWVGERYAIDAARQRSRFRALDDVPLEIRSARTTANEYENDAGDPYRAPPVQRARFDSIVIDGRAHSLDAVESFRLAKYSGVVAGYLIVEMRERARGTVRYQLAGFFGKSSRARARRLRDVLATLCDASVGRSVTLPSSAVSGGSYAGLGLLILELPVVIALVMVLPSIARVPAGGVRVLGAIVIGVVDWIRVRKLVRQEIAKRDNVVRALEERT